MNKVLLRSTLDRPNLHTLTDLLPLRNAPVLATATLSFFTLCICNVASLRILSKSVPPSVRASLRPFRYNEANLPLPPYLQVPYLGIFRFFILRSP